jgi:hypothetical protein
VDLSLVVLDKSLKAEVEFEEAVRVQFLEKASRISVDTARPGQIFGWSALTGRGRRTVTATCSLPARVAAIPAQNVISMCAKDPALGYELLKRLVGIIVIRLESRRICSCGPDGLVVRTKTTLWVLGLFKLKAAIV